MRAMPVATCAKRAGKLDLRDDDRREALVLVAHRDRDSVSRRTGDELLLGEARAEVCREADEMKENQDLVGHRDLPT